MARIVLALALLVAVAAAAPLGVVLSFDQWKVAYNKAYASEAHEARAAAVYAANAAIVAKLNEDEPDRPFGLTKFADMTPEEFRAAYLMPKGFLEKRLAARRANATYADLSGIDNVQLPTSFDWRNQGNFVTPVKNQGQCGSCWAFSATENIESVWAIQGKHDLVELSVQQIVSCDKVDQGCNGGDLPTAFEYVKKHEGLELNKNYPYTSGDGNTGVCKARTAKEVATFTGWHYATRDKNETAMQVYLQANAPLAICVDAETWQFYNGGVVKRNCGHQLDHCVMATGWGEADSVPYWSVRNSWGEDWGEKGYIRIERNDDLCGISKEPTSVYIR